MEFHHVPVLLHECLESLNIRPNGIYVDGTAGGGGHSQGIAERLTTEGRLIALDKDPDAIKAASQRLAPYPWAQVIESDYAYIPQVLDRLDVEKVDGILLDLGVSSYQLDNPERGFSYMEDGPLDMRMTQQGLSAYDIVNGWDVSTLARTFRELGEEQHALAIAKKINYTRQEAPITTTGQLVEIIRKGIPPGDRVEGGHPAKRVFQAIRMVVNGELEHLKACLEVAFDRLNPKGRFVIITFHSLEDRVVKQKFAALCKGCTCPPDFPICVCGKQSQGRLINKKPIEASLRERKGNSRSKSAKLRVIEKF